MNDSPFTEDEEALLARMPENGAPVGNISLRRALRWSEARYDEVRASLVDKGVIGVGKGQGGSLWLVQPHLLLLLVSVPSDGSFATRGSILKRTGWTEEKFLVVANIAIHRGVATPGPRNNLALIPTPEVEEFLLAHALDGDLSAFDATALAARLSWTVNRVHETRARILQKEHIRDGAEGEGGVKRRKSRPGAPARPDPEDVELVERADTAIPPRPRPVEVFVGYAAADAEIREQLYLHVSTLRRSGAVRDWSAEEILPGEELESTKRDKLNRADVVLLLISSDFIGSYGDEMATALERHRSGEAVVVPVIVRRCHWESTELGKLSPLPKGGRPIKSWPDIDEALYSVVQGIEAIVRARSER